MKGKQLSPEVGEKLRQTGRKRKEGAAYKLLAVINMP